MIRFTSRLLPYALVSPEALWVFVGLVTLGSDVDTKPSEVTLASLELETLPAADWITITDGSLDWLGSFYVAREDARGEEVSRDGYYVHSSPVPDGHPQSSPVSPSRLWTSTSQASSMARPTRTCCSSRFG